MVTGAFDPLHDGHRSYFWQARSFGSMLVCVVARDQTIERHKQRSVWQSESMRVQAIKRETAVDAVVLGDLYDPYVCLDVIRPEVICVGYDQVVFTQRLRVELAMRGLPTRIEVLHAFRPQRYKSSFARRIN